MNYIVSMSFLANVWNYHSLILLSFLKSESSSIYSLLPKFDNSLILIDDSGRIICPSLLQLSLAINGSESELEVTNDYLMR
ncbi:hypothetical protein DERP_010172 [Dermatophagoides pteronyssinus]|uniref:Uncharacterized protein n=1 Tax=Dermatophagoides pteronyssinus TaxID=6956 RepID=A0ABQ8J7D5_DERPT|nr:hypothetical protein DERP_010172 [Dermatophagoides pteronyssinus]